MPKKKKKLYLRYFREREKKLEVLQEALKHKKGKNLTQQPRNISKEPPELD